MDEVEIAVSDVKIDVQGGNEPYFSKSVTSSDCIKVCIRSNRYKPENDDIYLNEKIISNTLQVLEFL